MSFQVTVRTFLVVNERIWMRVSSRLSHIAWSPLIDEPISPTAFNTITFAPGSNPLVGLIDRPLGRRRAVSVDGPFCGIVNGGVGPQTRPVFPPNYIRYTKSP
jgi:hypothetical protein